MDAPGKSHGSLLAAIRAVLGRPPRPGPYDRYRPYRRLMYFLFFLEVVTGVMLSFYYDPDPEAAYGSIQAIMRDVSHGWLVRGLHAWGTQALVFLVLGQFLAVFLRGGYRRPYQSHWRLRFFLLLVFLLFAFTGEVLRGDAEGLAGAGAFLELVSLTPLVGEVIAWIVRGGEEVGAATMHNLYSIHILVLPALAIGIVLLFNWMEGVIRAEEEQP